MRNGVGSLLLLALCVGCGGAPPFDAATNMHEWESYMSQDHILVAGDQLTVAFPVLSETPQQTVVTSEGMVSIPRVPKPIKAQGRKLSDFRRIVQESINEAGSGLEVLVYLTKPLEKLVYIGGEVKSPAAIGWTANMTVARAIASAGSFLITAKDSDVLIVRPVAASGKPRCIRVNVDSILHGDQPDFALLPGDVIWAQTSTIADLGNLVELYIRRLLPFSLTGVSVGGNGK